MSAFALASALLACRAFVDLDGITGGPDVGDAAAIDATAEGSLDAPAMTEDGSVGNDASDGGADVAVDADADAAPELPVNGGFEAAGAACGPNWTPYQSSLTRSSIAFEGASSCRVCRNFSDAGPFDMVSLDNHPVVVGTTCTVTARIRSTPSDPAGAAISLGIDWHDINGIYISDDDRNDLAYDNQWTEFTHSAVVPAGIAKANVFVGGNGEESSCALVDRVTFSCN